MDEKLLELIAQLIDVRVTPILERELSPLQQVAAEFKQLPWALEYALIKRLQEDRPDFFDVSPYLIYEKCQYADANPDLTNKEPYYQGQSYFLNYSLSEVALEHFHPYAAGSQYAYGSETVEAWIEFHKLGEPGEDRTDVHFAERAFIVNVFVPAFGEEALQVVNPQYQVGPYAVDFAVQTTGGLVFIEVDGREYHHPDNLDDDRWQRELDRQNFLINQGPPLYRYTAQGVLKDPDSVIQQVRQQIHLPPIQGELFGNENGFVDDTANTQDNDASEIATLATAYCRWFRALQMGLLLALYRHRGRPRYVLSEQDAPPDLLSIALTDLACLISNLQDLYQHEIDWPETVVLQASSARTSCIYSDFIKCLTSGPDAWKETTTPFAISHDLTEQDVAVDLIIDLSRAGRIPLLPEATGTDVLGIESRDLAVCFERLKWLSIDRQQDRNDLRPSSVAKQTIDYFARRLLRVPALYHNFDAKHGNGEERQYELIKRVLEGKPTFGIMPTGRGKSLAFQLPALLMPGGAIVLSPLRALMRDQRDSLNYDRGVNTVAAIESGMSAVEKALVLKSFLAGHLKLLYVSPERIQIVAFSQELAEAAATVNISFVAIDEAHCVSEWGHDFRLSYMHIPYFQDDLRKQGNDCPIVALTATASPPVRTDVCSILKLNNLDAREGGHMVAESNVDRPELSLSVHDVTGTRYPEDRQQTLESVITSDLPKALQEYMNVWAEVANGGWKGKYAGAIFCLYKYPNGQTSWRDGVGSVHDFLNSRGVVDSDASFFYAADSPGFCPQCEQEGARVHSIRNVPQADGGGLTCLNGHQFGQALRYQEWDKRLRQLQHRFKHNEFPLLVTTKAYGMGIDHRGLRFIVHYGMPASLESYYQEIGRAGRDDKHAHCALLVRPPAQQCIDKLFVMTTTGQRFDELADSDFLPLCMQGENRTHNRCDPSIGLPEPCDLSRQLAFVMRSYIKPETFAVGCTKTWQRLSELAEDSNSRRVKLFVNGSGPFAGQTINKKHGHLFRLYQLGLLEVFRLEYRPASNDQFHVIFHAALSEGMNIETVLWSLATRIAEYQDVSAQATEAAQQEISITELAHELLVEFGVNLEDDLSDTFVTQAVKKLYSVVRGHVLKLRLQSFAKLQQYVDSREGCKRRVLVGGMTENAYGDDSYVCGHCNSQNCSPDLSFDRSFALVPAGTEQFRDLVDSALSHFDNEDVTSLLHLIEDATGRNCLGSLGHHATTYLESYPDNLAANLLAAAGLRINPDSTLRRYAHGNYRNFARISNVERRDSDLARIGLDAYAKYDAAEAIRSYAISDSAMDTKESLIHLEELSTTTNDLSQQEKDHLSLAHYAYEYHETAHGLGEFADELENAL